ncbi:MAG: septum site-determining protein MinD [Clostridiales bacterium]|nr:septum site-determining protein MinD [Clostridiales bacterium]
MGISVVITSGKGGTGKTTVTCGIASALAELGKRVLCVDVDIGLRNLDVTLGLADRALMDFSDVIAGRCPLEAAVCEHPTLKGLYLLNAPVTLPAARVTEQGMQELIGSARLWFDYVLIDCPAGIGSGFRLAVCAADQAIVVTTTEPASLRDAQMTVAQLRGYEIPIHLTVNRVNKRLMRRLRTSIDDAMDTAGLPLIGVIPEDDRVTELCAKGELMILHSRSGAARAYRNIASRLTGRRTPLMRI